MGKTMSAMNGRPPAKGVVKEKPKQESPAAAAKSTGEVVAVKSKRVETIRMQETVVGPKASNTRTDPKALMAQKKEARSRRWRYALALLLLLFLVGFAARELAKEKTLPPPEFAADGAYTPEGLRDRVKFHKNEVGHRLNRERINVHFENISSGTGLPSIVKPEADLDPLNGLPLAAEKHHRENSRDQHEKLDPSYADANVAYKLKEQQWISEWERAAQQQYIEEFIANAARSGYKVRVEPNGKVTVLGRIPAGMAPKKPINVEAPSGGGLQ